jgi:choline dehydrogenase-like flavoprotein
MIENGLSYRDQTITTDVCIIGSGPAGITAAWHLQNKGKKVTLIEGSRDFRGQKLPASWPDKKLLYCGVADGLFKDNECDFLIRPYDGHRDPSERERVYGGTSTHWGGQCRPLDAITFEERTGFPAWPIKRTDLNDAYAKAAKFLKLHTDNFTTEYWADELGITRSEVPDLEGFDIEMYQFRYVNFATESFEGKRPIGDLVDVILNASLLEIEHNAGRVNRLHVASMEMKDGKLKKATTFYIEAKAYVLACGSVANARQLLLSNAGNEHYQVGHYFMCHPYVPSGVVTITGSFPDPETNLMTGYQQNGGRWMDTNGVTVEGRFSPTAEAQRMWAIGSCWFGVASGGCYFEMAPNYASRVTLADTCDEVFGQKQTRITWELSDRDEATYNHSKLLFQNAIEKLNEKLKDKIEVSFASWDEVKKQLAVNGHHIGTTRMSDQPQDGVVDKNLKVHTLDKLYVAGASVFASAGISNPTFTIVALSIRLAEHLSEIL